MNQSLESESALGTPVSVPGSARPAAPVAAPAAILPEAAGGSAADSAADTPADTPADLGPAALADLVAAGLVSHEMIGDPARLGGEAATLRALCRHVPGAIWRIEPYHYAFRITAEGVPEVAGAALEARLAAELGADAVWVNPTDLLAGDLPQSMGESAAAAADTAVDLDAPLLLLRASAEAVAEGLAFAGPEVQAIVSAGFASRAARIAASQIEAIQIEAVQIEARTQAKTEADAELARRLAGIEAAIAAEAEVRAARAGAEVRLTELLAKVLRRLDAQADVLHGHIAREDKVAERLGEIAALAGSAASSAPGSIAHSTADFAETLGLALAEFLARLERREAAVERAAGQGSGQQAAGQQAAGKEPARVSQVS